MAAPLLAVVGYRVIVPYLRGFGTTNFVSQDVPRNGQQSVFASDAIALLDALGIERAIAAGCDWGARTACILAALWPERCTALVSVSGYLIGSQKANMMPLPPAAELSWWYQSCFATERGRAGYDANRADFAKLIWRTASPPWRFDDATFARTARALENPDHVAIVIDNYRWRLGLSAGDPAFDALEQRRLLVEKQRERTVKGRRSTMADHPGMAARHKAPSSRSIQSAANGSNPEPG